jgi:hypothetical protein
MNGEMPLAIKHFSKRQIAFYKPNSVVGVEGNQDSWAMRKTNVWEINEKTEEYIHFF